MKAKKRETEKPKNNLIIWTIRIILKYKTRNINTALRFIVLFLPLVQFSFAQLSDLDTRCLWIVRDSMYSKEMINSALVYAYQTGYNIVFVQVRGR